MQQVWKFSFAVALSALLVACGSTAAKDKKGEITDIKSKLEKLKKDKTGLDTEIRQLEEQLAKADPDAASVKKLIAVDTLRIQDFAHYIDLRGKISSSGIGYVAPKGGGGVIRAIYVKVGDRVSSGQLVVKLDDVIQRQALIGAQQATGQLKARVAQAQTIYERYQNLWKQNIGAEINVVNAKADVDALTAQLRSARIRRGSSGRSIGYDKCKSGYEWCGGRSECKSGRIF